MRDWENNIRRVVPYTPGEQPKNTCVIKLNTNEPIDVGTDEKGIYERVIDIEFYYERNE